MSEKQPNPQEEQALLDAITGLVKTLRPKLDEEFDLSGVDTEEIKLYHDTTTPIEDSSIHLILLKQTRFRSKQDGLFRFYLAAYEQEINPEATLLIFKYKPSKGQSLIELESVERWTGDTESLEEVHDPKAWQAISLDEETEEASRRINNIKMALEKVLS